MPSLDRIRRSFAQHEPELLDPAAMRQAAVAMVLRVRGGAPEVLFIERARHPRDPWSGHMAFPGGRVDPADATARLAAERETLEEVGVPLGGGERLGQLDDQKGHRASGVPNLVISGFVYHVAEPPPLVTNHEVRDAFWFPVHSLRDPARHVDHPNLRRAGLRYPGIVVGDPERHVVWGLTYRFLEIFFRILGEPLADRWVSLGQARGGDPASAARDR
jgi:8-oxo-dGTP pyrophosphatase MutT (NUDIX family)